MGHRLVEMGLVMEDDIALGHILHEVVFQYRRPFSFSWCSKIRP